MMGFSPNFMSRAMACVRTVSFSILLSDTSSGLFCPSRGLRQGDPISLYLFLFYVKGLSCMLRKMEVVNYLYSVFVARACPKVSHLLFADDYFIFCDVTKRDCGALLDILMEYDWFKKLIYRDLMFFLAPTFLESLSSLWWISWAFIKY